MIILKSWFLPIVLNCLLSLFCFVLLLAFFFLSVKLLLFRVSWDIFIIFLFFVSFPLSVFGPLFAVNWFILIFLFIFIIFFSVVLFPWTNIFNLFKAWKLSFEFMSLLFLINFKFCKLLSFLKELIMLFLSDKIGKLFSSLF